MFTQTFQVARVARWLLRLRTEQEDVLDSALNDVCVTARLLIVVLLLAAQKKMIPIVIALCAHIFCTCSCARLCLCLLYNRCAVSPRRRAAPGDLTTNSSPPAPRNFSLWLKLIMAPLYIFLAIWKRSKSRNITCFCLPSTHTRLPAKPLSCQASVSTLRSQRLLAQSVNGTCSHRRHLCGMSVTMPWFI